MPKPLDTSDIDLPRDLMPLLEAMSKNCHEVWAAQRISEGWTYGAYRNDAFKQTPCMVPYEDLPETEKVYDRATSLETLKFIKKSGYEIYKVTQPKVLWITDGNLSDYGALKNKADECGLQLFFCQHWEEALHLMEDSFDDWGAIVINSYGCQSAWQEPSGFFLRDVLDELNALFNRRIAEIPWYVIADREKKYDVPLDYVLRYSIGQSRSAKDWGKTVFEKDDSEQLFDTINKVMPKLANYRVNCIYGEIFSIVDKYFPPEAKPLLCSMLRPLHFPEQFHSFRPEEFFDNVRRVVEAFFKVCNHYGLIPNEVCYDHDNGTVNLRHSCDYMFEGRGKTIFPNSISQMLSFILSMSNMGCHIDDRDSISNFSYSVLGFALQLCDVILWFGHYCAKHQLRSVDELVCEYEGKEVTIQCDELGNYFYGDCCFGKNPFFERVYLKGDPVTIADVKLNTYSTRRWYKLTGRIVKK